MVVLIKSKLERYLDLLVLSPDMAKLSSEKIVQETNHRWLSPLYSIQDMMRPVIEVGGGNLLHSFLLLF
jgi:hypothetical protein